MLKQKKDMYSFRAPTRLDEYLKPPLEMRVGKSVVGNSFEPDMFGPSFWFTLHNGAAAYPEHPTPQIQQGMRMFIMGLPVMIPCTLCKEHAFEYIRNHDLNYETSSRERLFAFFNRFHNFANARFNKREMPLTEAKQLYGFGSVRGGRMRITYT